MGTFDGIDFGLGAKGTADQSWRQLIYNPPTPAAKQNMPITSSLLTKTKSPAKFPLPGANNNGVSVSPINKSADAGGSGWGLLGAGIGGAAGLGYGLLNKKKHKPLATTLAGALLGAGAGIGAHHLTQSITPPTPPAVTPPQTPTPNPTPPTSTPEPQYSSAVAPTPPTFMEAFTPMAGGDLANTGLTAGMAAASRRYPGVGRTIGNIWSRPVANAGMAANAGRIGGNLVKANLPINFALDALNVAGLNPIGSDFLHPGRALHPDVALSRAEDLAAQPWHPTIGGPNVIEPGRLLSGYMNPLSTIAQGTALSGEAALDNTAALNSNQDAVSAWQRAHPNEEMPLEHSRDTNQSAQNIMNPLRWVTSPFENVGEMTNVYHGAHDTALRHHNWYNQADERLATMPPSPERAALQERVSEREGPLGIRRGLANIINSTTNRQVFNPLRDSISQFRFPWQN